MKKRQEADNIHKKLQYADDANDRVLHANTSAQTRSGVSPEAGGKMHWSRRELRQNR